MMNAGSINKGRRAAAGLEVAVLCLCVMPAQCAVTQWAGFSHEV